MAKYIISFETKGWNTLILVFTPFFIFFSLKENIIAIIYLALIVLVVYLVATLRLEHQENK